MEPAATAAQQTRVPAAADQGVQLPEGLRGRFEGSLGQSLGDVRIHAGPEDTGEASSRGARAVTHGQDIWFGAGEYQPETAAGQHVLAHEVAHAAQQGAAPGGAATQAFTELSQPGDAAERQAEHAAVAMTRGQPATVSRMALGVARFGAEEHRDMAGEAAGQATEGGAQELAEIQLETDPAHPLQFRDIVMLGGDLYGSPQEIFIKSQNPAGRAELAWARWWARHRKEREADGWTEPAFDEAKKQPIKDQFDKLAGDNYNHFTQGSRYGYGKLAAPGTYEQGHMGALAIAYLAAQKGDEALREYAMILEGYAQHFLSDMFAAGHIRTPRQEIESYYLQKFPDSLDRIIRKMARSMVRYLKSENEFSSRLAEIPLLGVDLQEEIEAKIRKLGGVKLEVYTMADIISEAYHLVDGKGLDVVSDVNLEGNSEAGGFKWRASGDNATGAGSTGSKMAVAAMRASLQELEQAREFGGSQRGVAGADADTAATAVAEGMKPYQALSFVPRADEDSLDNKYLEWRWGEWSSAMMDSLDEVITTEVVPELDKVRPSHRVTKGSDAARVMEAWRGAPDQVLPGNPDDPNDDKVGWNDTEDVAGVTDLDTGDAFEHMTNEIKAYKHGWLILAMLED